MNTSTRGIFAAFLSPDRTALLIAVRTWREFRKPLLQSGSQNGPFLIQDRKIDGVPKVAGPGNSIPAEHALSDSPQFRHCSGASLIPCINPELRAHCSR